MEQVALSSWNVWLYFNGLGGSATMEYSVYEVTYSIVEKDNSNVYISGRLQVGTLSQNGWKNWDGSTFTDSTSEIGTGQTDGSATIQAVVKDVNGNKITLTGTVIHNSDVE